MLSFIRQKSATNIAVLNPPLPPAITSSASPSVAENVTLSHALTANVAVTWSIVGGADQTDFEISGSTLRWASNGVQDFEAPADANADNAYIVDVRATDGFMQTADQTITVTVTNVVESSLSTTMMLAAMVTVGTSRQYNLIGVQVNE